MKIYFAGSIRGGRDDVPIYKLIIDHLKEDHQVLTEHIGDLNYKFKERDLEGDRQVYIQDTSYLNEADIVIAECTTPSLGVGYELAYAESKKIPVYVLYNKNKGNISAMVSGNSYFKLYPYRKLEELPIILNTITNI